MEKWNNRKDIGSLKVDDIQLKKVLVAEQRQILAYGANHRLNKSKKRVPAARHNYVAIL